MISTELKGTQYVIAVVQDIVDPMGGAHSILEHVACACKHLLSVNNTEIQVNQCSPCTNHWLLALLSSKKFSHNLQWAFFSHNEINLSWMAHLSSLLLNYLFTSSTDLLIWNPVVSYIQGSCLCLVWETAQTVHTQAACSFLERGYFGRGGLTPSHPLFPLRLGTNK